MGVALFCRERGNSLGDSCSLIFCYFDWIKRGMLMCEGYCDCYFSAGWFFLACHSGYRFLGALEVVHLVSL